MRRQFAAGVDRVLSTFALTLVPEFDTVIAREVVALGPRGRFVILGFGFSRAAGGQAPVDESEQPDPVALDAAVN